jgi:hypothetical protein
VLDKFKVSLPSFDVNSLLISLKESLTAPNPEHLEKRELPSCDLVTIREGVLPAVLVINGFLTENDDSTEDWLEVVDKLYPENKVVRVNWKAGNIKDMMFDKGVVPNLQTGHAGKTSLATTLLARTNLLGMIATTSAFVVDKVLGHWKTSFYETCHVASSLAEILENTKDEQFILMGHSLGGRIVRHTLAALETSNLVSVAYVFAGAVSSEDEEWVDILEKHTELKLINCMSMKDVVLKSAYKAGTLWDHEPAGLAEIMDNHPHTLNLDVTEYASGHTEYKQQELGMYLKDELGRLDSHKKRQLHLLLK